MLTPIEGGGCQKQPNDHKAPSPASHSFRFSAGKAESRNVSYKLAYTQYQSSASTTSKREESLVKERARSSKSINLPFRFRDLDSATRSSSSVLFLPYFVIKKYLSYRDRRTER
mmetsp:Transcript_10254/g.23326  ORF Transcript_10254/g.23326 Transcript_10254/m.23326 type:complete len:114 (-) Transcript_10254:16-357(-)